MSTNKQKCVLTVLIKTISSLNTVGFYDKFNLSLGQEEITSYDDKSFWGNILLVVRIFHYLKINSFIFKTEERNHFYQPVQVGCHKIKYMWELH